MFNPGKVGRILSLIIIVFSLLVISQVSGADKKLKVIKDGAQIHLNPDNKSLILENVAPGTILGLLSPVILKASWYYINYQST